MTLSPENLVYYLLERGIITRKSIVNGGVEISEIGRRNRNFRVKQRQGQGYFVKQVRRFDPDSVRTLHAEAQCYELAAKNETFGDIAEIVPHFHCYDQRRSVLITELLEDAETITEHHFRNGSFPVDVGEQLGRVFGNYHRKSCGNPPVGLNGTFLRRPAWALSLHDMPPHAAPNLSGGIHQMLGMVRQFPQFATVLEKLRAEWAFDVLIHGDIKWDNCVLCPRSDGSFSLKIVDWEMADWGDSCWDLAGILSAYLSFWVQSLPGNGLTDPATLMEQARFPIEKMQPAIRRFWKTYTQCRGVSGDAARELLRRTTMYTGARNIQTAFEYLQSSPQANASTVLLLQLSMNVLNDPEEASRELLGIEA
jgi:aminoglycoside phosphotransferase (APT) family kinase protein